MLSTLTVHYIPFQRSIFWKNGKTVDAKRFFDFQVFSCSFRFEIIVTLTGTSSVTGHTREERTSYVSNEVIWGHRFVNIVEYDAKNEEYRVDYTRFDKTEEVNFVNDLLALVFEATVLYFQIETMLCSAQQCDKIRKKLEVITRIQ